MSVTKTQSDSIELNDYYENEVGFQLYLHDLADDVWMYPGYRDGQGEALKESLEEFFLNGKDNVITALPTGVGKSGINTAISLCFQRLAANKRNIEAHFGVSLDIGNGDSFYTTPQRQLRNQLANDEDLQEHVAMLAARADYTCGVSGKDCDSCPVQSDPDESCMEQANCTYWNRKMEAMASPIAALTFAMLIVDNSMPPETEDGRPLSFSDRDLVIVDEGHNLENQAASLFAGFSVSPWTLPEEVYKNAGARADWDADRFEDVEEILRDLNQRARNYIQRYEDNPDYSSRVDKCENFLRKLNYCTDEIHNDRPWVVNVDETKDRSGNKTKKIQLKPVYVDRFLENYIWSRGNKRVISSATIPYRNEIETWCERIGLPGETALISKTMPFKKQHRPIITGTLTGSMSGSDESENWNDAMEKILEIKEHHKGERGLIHTNSYLRAEKVKESLGNEVVMVDEKEKDQSVVIDEWQSSEKQLLASPAMNEGVDLHGDLCRWQVLLKVPFGMVGDSRVSYFLNELHQWDWYYQTASIHIQQSVGRAVRGPEPSEAAAFYVLDSKFEDVIGDRTNPPKWFSEAIINKKPNYWKNPSAAPWR